MDPPRLAEHGAEAEGEPGHEDPGPGRAHVREVGLRRQVGVQAKQDHGDVGQDAANDYQVVHVWRGHLDLPPEL